MDKYRDIINYNYCGIRNHKPMDLTLRAKEFLSFAALSGYSEIIDESSRIVNMKYELTDMDKELINSELLMIQADIKNNPMVRIVYFVPDKRKCGGEYDYVIGQVKQIDEVNRVIILRGNIKIAWDLIRDIKKGLT